MHDILLIDKPYAYSSFQAVATVKKILKIKKLGHGGTLDPLAVGMLPICLGDSRKFASFLLDADKHYTVTAELGCMTTTGDLEGNIIDRCDVNNFGEDQIDIAMQDMVGVLKQVPPMFSALKYMGKPLYEYARKGIEVSREAREISIFKFKLLKWQSPYLTCEVQCGKGTYIRTLLGMLGEKLGVGGASLSMLRRDWVAPFVSHKIVTLEELAFYYNENRLSDMSGFARLDNLFNNYPRLNLTLADAKTIAYGQSLFHDVNFPRDTTLALFINNEFLGLAQATDSKLLKVKKLRQSLVQNLCSVT